ncbi:hypothetical protein PIB30_093630, partial [Stylosanthes scabra]|nr:hypothetical protein [Stylosanthes scabra]
MGGQHSMFGVRRCAFGDKLYGMAKSYSREGIDMKVVEIFLGSIKIVSYLSYFSKEMGKKSAANKGKAVAEPAKKSVRISIAYFITTEKIGHALGLSSRGTRYDIKVDKKKLSQEDIEVLNFFQGSTTVALQNLIKTTPVDTDENKKLWMRAFMLFVQQVFLLPNSTAKITPMALPTIFDLENTRNRNWAHHVHNFLLQELKKAKQKKSVAIHGCCYALMIIYFHETQFGERSRDPAAQPPLLAYWTGDMLKKRLKLEKKHDAGLLKTGKLRAEKEDLKKKSTDMVLSDGEGDSESESPSSLNSEDTVSDEPQQKERRMKRKNDRGVVGSNAPFNPTQQSASVDGLPGSENETLAALAALTRKRKKQQTEVISTKKRSVQGVEGGEEMQDVRRPASEADNGSDRTRIFDSFDTVSLGRGETVEGPSITLSQPSQPSQTGKCDLQAGPEAEPKAESEAQAEVGIVIGNEQQHDPVTVEAPFQPEQPSTPQHNEVDDPMPLNMEMGPNTIKAMRYNFLTMAPATCIDIQMLPHRLELLKDHADYMGLLDRDKLKSHSSEFYIIDFVHGINPNQQRAKLHRFVPNPYDCGVYVMKWMELLDAATLSGCYAYKVRYSLDEWGQVNKMGRQTKPSAALQSPYVQVSTAELEKR